MPFSIQRTDFWSSITFEEGLFITKILSFFSKSSLLIKEGDPGFKISAHYYTRKHFITTKQYDYQNMVKTYMGKKKLSLI